MLTGSDFPSFDEKLYIRIGLNDLVTYSVYSLSKRGTFEISAEDIVAACFLMFPGRFALRGYPQWPDSTVVNKRWIDCRNKGLISGSTANGFTLTPKGLELAEKIEKILLGSRPLFTRATNKPRSEQRTRAGRFVRIIEESDAFAHFQKEGVGASINEFDFRSMLLCTMESSARTLRNNLDQFKQYVMLYERTDLLQFLEYVEKRFHSLLEDPKSDRAGRHGGMLTTRGG